MDSKTLDEVMRYCRNYFVSAFVEGDFTIEFGQITLPESFNGDYILIEGSKRNNGVHIGTCGLNDEVFHGVVYTLAPDDAFLSVVEEISKWQDKFSSADSSPYQSESFGGYSYSKKTNSNGATGWHGAFASRLNPWRCL